MGKLDATLLLLWRCAVSGALVAVLAELSAEGATLLL